MPQNIFQIIGKISDILGQPVELQAMDPSWTSFDPLPPKLPKGGHGSPFIGRFRLLTATETVTAWEFWEMAACCGIIISSRVSVSQKFRNRGIGTQANLLRIALACHYGYSGLICTDISTNTSQRRILVKNGWKDAITCVNRRTNNTVNLSYIKLSPQEKTCLNPSVPQLRHLQT